jgi:soluble lytic murein transglycosylase-like protein
VLDQIAQCESGGNPRAVSPDGLYRGKYQFHPDTWRRLGGRGTDPAAAPEAEQDRVAALLYAREGAAPWPICGG